MEDSNSLPGVADEVPGGHTRKDTEDGDTEPGEAFFQFGTGSDRCRVFRDHARSSGRCRRLRGECRHGYSQQPQKKYIAHGFDLTATKGTRFAQELRSGCLTL